MNALRVPMLCMLAAAGSPTLMAAQEEHVHDPAATAETSGTSAASPRTPIPPLTAADRAAAQPPTGGHPAHDNGIYSYVLADHIEAWNGGGDSALAWEAEGWVGTDLDRLWWRSRGERQSGETSAADVEVLYGRGIAPWWDLVVGARHDFRPRSARSFLALGIQGLAPQNFGVQATAYIGDGQTAARLETSYQLLLTNRWILEPQLELEMFGSDEPERGIGAGPAVIGAGLRLRHEITRRFAPYLGLAWERALGETADLRRASGESVDEVSLVAGIRLWF